MSIRKKSNVSFAKTTLPCPIYAAEFDPYNRGYLIVGGGGGESKTGVANQISVLDVSNRATITTAVDVELSREEDSVQSVSSLSTKDGLIVFAGINSSMKDQEAGKNEHFRSFAVTCPPRKKQKTEETSQDEKEEKGEWKALGRRALFKTSTATRKETYQRILRLSPSRRRESGSNRIGAVASGLAKESEIIVFDATTTLPDNIITRITLSGMDEAVDFDIFDTDEGQFSLVYCTDYEMFEQTFEYDFKSKKAKKIPKDPRQIYKVPVPTAPEDPTLRPKFRSLRFLNSQHVVALLNRPKKSGAELQAFHLYPDQEAIQVKQKALPWRMKQAVSLDVCALDPDKLGSQQIVMAVAGQDVSIEVYTTNYMAKTDNLSPFRQYLTLKDVHEHQMTKICFSPYFSPLLSPSSSDKSTKITKPGPQYIRLASVSMGNTVVVDTFPLQPLKPKDDKTRYVLAHPISTPNRTWLAIILLSMFIAAMAYLYQTISIGYPKVVQKYKDFHKSSAAVPIVSTASTAPASTATERLYSLLSAHDIEHPTDAGPETAQQTAIIFRPDAESAGVALHVHPDKQELLEQDEHAKHWHELEEHQKANWKEKLKRAGHWAEGEGEGIFQGILFSEFAGMMGQVAADVLHG